jgi:FeS assembly SUF system protein
MLRLRVEEALASIYDPEIPVNIYELGLIYSVEVGADGKVTVKMTLTAPGCPAAQSLPVEVERKVAAIAAVSDIQVEVVWDPPWGPDRMSEAARLQLGLL